MAHEAPRTNLFWPPWLRICGGSRRWSLGHRRSGSVHRVAWELRKEPQGQRVKAAALNERPKGLIRLQPTFATKLAHFGPHAMCDLSLQCAPNQTSANALR